MVELHIFDDVKDLYHDAAQRIGRAAREAVAARGRFTLTLSGGNTPRPLYTLLASPKFAGAIEWAQTHLFWGDERMVPISDAQSNYRMAAESLLRSIDIPPENVHRIRTGVPPDQSAQQYETELRKFFGTHTEFDVTLLGMGPDGHTASLFPGSPALGQGNRLAVPVFEKDPRRVSLTFPALNASRQVIFHVIGSDKAKPLAEVLEGPETLPAALVRPASGNVCWLVDTAAASLLQRRAPAT